MQVYETTEKKRTQKSRKEWMRTEKKKEWRGKHQKKLQRDFLGERKTKKTGSLNLFAAKIVIYSAHMICDKSGLQKRIIYIPSRDNLNNREGATRSDTHRQILFYLDYERRSM